MADIPDPTVPPPTPAGTLPSPVQPLVGARAAGATFAPGYDLALPSYLTGAAVTDLDPGSPSARWLKAVGLRQDFGERPSAGIIAPRALWPALKPLAMDVAPPLEAFPSGVGGPLDLDLIGAARAGLADTVFGSATRWLEMRKAATWKQDPDYDPFADRQIEDAGLTNRIPELFLGSGSRDQTRYLINRYQQQLKEADQFERMDYPGVASAAQTAAGLLLDPLNYLPSTLGVKGVSLLGKAVAGRITGAELKLMTAKPAIYGGLADALRSSGIQMAVSLAEQSMQHRHVGDRARPAGGAGRLGRPADRDLRPLPRRQAGRPADRRSRLPPRHAADRSALRSSRLRRSRRATDRRGRGRTGLALRRGWPAHGADRPAQRPGQSRRLQAGCAGDRLRADAREGVLLQPGKRAVDAALHDPAGQPRGAMPTSSTSVLTSGPPMALSGRSPPGAPRTLPATSSVPSPRLPRRRASA
jgi:hypothetical protein